MRSNPTLFLAEPKGEDEMASSLLDALGFNETIDCKVMKPANKLISSLFLPLFFFLILQSSTFMLLVKKKCHV